MNNLKIFIDGVEIKRHIDPTSSLIILLMKLGLKAKLEFIVKPIEILGVFDPVEL